MSSHVASLATLLLFAAAGCVDALEHEQLGRASFLGGASIHSADYDGRSLPPSAAAAASAAGATAAPATGVGAASRPAAAGGAAPAVPIAGAGAGAAAASGGTRAAAPAAGTAGSAGAAAGSGAPAAPPATTGPSIGMLSIAFTSVDQDGRYAPRNVGAVWIETSSGMFVRTLERWAGIRANHLSRWAEASGGWGGFFGGGNTADMMDAMSRATLRTHQAHQLTWNMQDATGAVVADGAYRVVIEVADDEVVAGASGEVEFMKGPVPQTIMVADKPPWSSLVVTYQP